MLYNYTNSLTGNDKFLHQSPEIELTDDYLILYNPEDLKNFRERIEYFNQTCRRLLTNGFTLEYRPNRFRTDYISEEFSPRYDTQDLIRRLEFKLKLLQKAFENYIKLNEVLSNTYVSHLTGFENFKNIVQNGALASQAYLIERGLIPIPRSEGGQKQTLTDISFSFGLEMQYGEMGFIFPTTPLLQDHVFYLRASSQYSFFPELHIYDKNFDENRNKRGTFVDLSRAILLIPKVNKIPRTTEEKQALESVFKDLLMMEGAIKLLKINKSSEEALKDSQCYYSSGQGIIGFITNSPRYFDWQLAIEEVQEMLDEDKDIVLGKLNQEIREYKSRPELEGLNIFVAVEELASHSYITRDIEDNMEYYLTYDIESYWRNYLYQLSQDRNSWLYGEDVDRWIESHVIFYDRRIYLTIEKLMREYSSELGNLSSKQFNIFLRYIRKLFKKHAKPLLETQPKGRIVPTNQIARPLRRDKNIILFRFVGE